MASVHPISGPDFGLSMQNFDCVMENQTGGAVTKGTVLAVKLPVALTNLNDRQLYKEVGDVADAADDDVDNNITGLMCVALEDAADEARLRVRFQGICHALAGGTVNIGDMCTVDGNGKLVAAAGGDKVVASYPGVGPLGTLAAAAADDLVQVYFDGLNGFGNEA